MEDEVKMLERQQASRMRKCARLVLASQISHIILYFL